MFCGRKGRHTTAQQPLQEDPSEELEEAHEALRELLGPEVRLSG